MIINSSDMHEDAFEMLSLFFYCALYFFCFCFCFPLIPICFFHLEKYVLHTYVVGFFKM